MERHLDKRQMKKWVESVGGLKAATQLIKIGLEVSDSKAEKVASGRYPSLPSPAEQMMLATLMNVSRDTLFPLAPTKGKRRAS